MSESLEEFRNSQDLNEGLFGSSSKSELLAFLKNPEKNIKNFKLAFKDQIKRFPGLSEAIDALDIESKKNLAKKGIDFIKANPSQDNLKLPIFKKGGQLVIDTEGKHGNITGSGVSGRQGIHGGTSTSA